MRNGFMRKYMISAILAVCLGILSGCGGKGDGAGKQRQGNPKRKRQPAPGQRRLPWKFFQMNIRKSTLNPAPGLPHERCLQAVFGYAPECLFEAR